MGNRMQGRQRSKPHSFGGDGYNYGYATTNQTYGTQSANNGEPAQPPRRSKRFRKSRSRDKIVSCPDLVRSNTNTLSNTSRSDHGGPVEEERKIELKIYRSYSDLQQGDSIRSSYADLNPPIEIRVYRRSTESLAGKGTYGGRTQSLPRGMERMSAGMASMAASQDWSSTSTTGGGGGAYYPSHPPSTCSGMTGGGGVGGGHEMSSRSSRRTSARSSMASIQCRISPEDYPDVPTIRRKLSEFAAHFRHNLIETFQCLPPLNQLSSIAIATRPDRANQSLSLLQYLESDSIPVDLLQPCAAAADEGDLGGGGDLPRREYYLTISPALFEKVRRVRTEGLADQRLAVARDVVTSLAEVAAADICRMFEYQLSLIHETIAIRMLAKYAVDCVYDVMKRRQRLLDRNTIVQGAVKGRPRDGTPAARKLISVIVGSKELKWNIFDIFKKPALRKELFLTATGGGSGGNERRKQRLPSVSMEDGLHRTTDGGSPGSRTDTSRDGSGHHTMTSSGESSGGGSMIGGGGGGGGWGTSREEDSARSWRYFASSQSEPMLYGYRGQMIEWDYVNEHFRLNSDEEATFSEEVSFRYDDFHRMYCPYLWLIGLDVIRDYKALINGGGSGEHPSSHPDTQQTPTIVEFVKQSRGGAYYVRDDIRLVFRPLGSCGGVTVLDVGMGVEVGGGCVNNNDIKTTVVSDAAIEITRACSALCSRLDEEEGRGGGDGGGGGGGTGHSPRRRLVDGDMSRVRRGGGEEGSRHKGSEEGSRHRGGEDGSRHGGGVVIRVTAPDGQRTGSPSGQ